MVWSQQSHYVSDGIPAYVEIDLQNKAYILTFRFYKQIVYYDDWFKRGEEIQIQTKIRSSDSYENCYYIPADGNKGPLIFSCNDQNIRIARYIQIRKDVSGHEDLGIDEFQVFGYFMD